MALALAGCGFAAGSGMTANIGSVERGERNISLKNLLRIADALGMTLSQLIAAAEQLAASEED